MTQLENLYSKTSRKIIAKRIAKRENESMQENLTRKDNTNMKKLLPYAIAFLVVMFLVNTFETLRCITGLC